MKTFRSPIASICLTLPRCLMPYSALEVHNTTWRSTSQRRAERAEPEAFQRLLRVSSEKEHHDRSLGAESLIYMCNLHFPFPRDCRPRLVHALHYQSIGPGQPGPGIKKSTYRNQPFLNMILCHLVMRTCAGWHSSSLLFSE
jgi:hypothetical protein